MADRGTLEFNGSVFEDTIARHLKQWFPDSIVLSNLELSSAYLGKVTQIDLIMIHSKGIFVIEAKAWHKWVRGTYDDSQWLGKSQSPDVIRTFSPVNQNFIHVRTLRNAIRRELGKEPPVFHSVICFPDSTDLNTPCKEVVNLSSLKSYLQSLMVGNLDVREWKEAIIKVTNSKSEEVV